VIAHVGFEADIRYDPFNNFISTKRAEESEVAHR
jgi:hypothetical protein